MQRRLALFLLVLSFVIAAGAGAATMPNAILPDGSPGFALSTKSPGPPQLLIGFNAKGDQPITGLQPGPQQIGSGPPIIGLDLTDPANPLINNTGAGPAFSIFFALYPPDPGLPAGSVNPGPPGIQFLLPMDAATGALRPPNPNADGSFGYSFGATDGTNNFDMFFTITGGTPMDTASWGWSVPGTPDLPAVQFDFSFQTFSDPVLAFSVYENGQRLEFAPVPEPSTMLLLGSGLAGLVFASRRRGER